MENHDDQLEAWLLSGNKKQERRANVVHPSSERLVSQDPGDGESAVEAVASWLGTRPNLPIVELANLSRRSITLTFAEPAVLPDPWVNPKHDSREASDLWGITLQHAMGLERSEGYGWQVSGLTGLGTLADHSRALLNTTRWELMGIAGSPSWTKHLMTTQVMNQAAEPWSNNHDIWLVGYGELGDKLMSFLSPYHPVQHFRTVDSLDQIEVADLHGGNATIYVMGATNETAQQFASLDANGVGMITDRIISDECMFLTERADNAAAIGPFKTNLEIFPNHAPELIEAMERAWEANAQLAAAKVAEADFSQLFEKGEIPTLEEQSKEGKEKRVVREERENDAPEDPQNQLESNEASVSVSKAPDLDEPHESFEDLTTELARLVEEENEESTEVEPRSSNLVNEDTTVLKILGSIKVHTSAGELSERNAEAIALLKLSDHPLSPQDVSEALWPGDKPDGNTARTRRTRMLGKIRDTAGEIIQTEDGWELRDEAVLTDFEQILKISDEDLSASGERIAALLSQVEQPLMGASEWANEHRKTISDRLKSYLSELLAKALEEDAFPVAKAAQKAIKKLEEN